MFSHIKRSLRTFVFSADGTAFVERFNFFNRLYWRLPLVLSWNADSGSYVVMHGADSLTFSRKERVWVYAKGIARRLATLASMYMVHHVPLRPGDTVIDCGANIGEFSSYVGKMHGAQVIAVEPEAAEANCIAHNVPGVRAVINRALWKESGFVEFFSKNDTADSSIFEVAGYQQKTRVATITLAEIFAEYGIDRVRLLKLEAEGAEPEILDGAEVCLRRIDYITADLGPERGVRKETTLAPVVNRLYASGFELVDVYARRLICLFRNVGSGGK